MTRVFDFTIVSVVVLVSLVVHRMGVELLAPGTVLYEVATDGTANVGGEQFANFVWQAIAIWIPLLVFFSILAWAMVREYRRQTVTAGARRPV